MANKAVIGNSLAVQQLGLSPKKKNAPNPTFLAFGATFDILQRTSKWNLLLRNAACILLKTVNGKSPN